jgi:hypothetical protein
MPHEVASPIDQNAERDDFGPGASGADAPAASASHSTLVSVSTNNASNNSWTGA